MKYLLFVLLIVTLVFYGQSAAKSAGITSDATSQVLKISGNIDVDDTEVSFKIAGRVTDRCFSEGQMITAGQTVAHIDDTELVQDLKMKEADRDVVAASLAELEAGSRPEEIAQAEATVRKVQAQLAELLAGTRSQDIEAIKAIWDRSKADAANAASELERQTQLFKEKAVASRDLDNAKAASDMAQARLSEAEARLRLAKVGARKEQVEAARNALNEAEERLKLIKKGPRAETIAQTRARLELASRTIDLARTRVGNATLVSPISGTVLTHNIQPGEYVSPGTPILTVADLSRVWVRAFIPETDLGKVKLGQKVFVSGDSYPEKRYEGKIVFISSQAEFTPKSIQTYKERVKLVYRIKVDITNPNQELKPGMPVDVDIQMIPQ
ncbi:MAG: efflux RND transporter periplasmic adaptor subunit [Candidatus Riflebacteria bacterium]|nr:efflux RND transporter periplasmic adaptor subunit [Candidatus Riflebacteria bacterium]